MNISQSNQIQFNGPYFCGVDVGGTNIKMGIVDDHGQTVWFKSIPTEAENGPRDAMQRVAHCFENGLKASNLDRNEFGMVGLGTPGTMDIPHGVILEPPNLPAWRHYPIRDDLAKRLQLQVAYTNDANAAAFGEFWIGSAKDYESMVMITLGTGVGGGIIVFGKSIDGVNSHGSEVGHTIVDTRDVARVCSCGQKGHLEAYASATAVAARAKEGLTKVSDKKLAADNRRKTTDDSSLHLVLKQNGRIEAFDVWEHAQAGDAYANELVVSTADYLAVGIVNVAHLIDPEAIVLGGAMDFGGCESIVGLQFIERIRSEVKRLAFSVVSNRLKIAFAELGGNAGFIGAAGIARAKHNEIKNNDSRVNEIKPA